MAEIEGGFAQQLEIMRQRLVALHNRLSSQSSLDPVLQRQIAAQLQLALEILQRAQVAPQQEGATQQQVACLQVSLQEKEVLLRELHHRVKNNLQIVSSLLDIQAIRSTDPTVQALLRSNQSRINSIALVHERLSQASDLTEISLGEYVQSLATTLVRTYAIDASSVTLQLNIQTTVLISPDRAIPIGLILNELISNALKHGLQGGAGAIAVQLASSVPPMVTLTVTNTGNRLPEWFNPLTASSLGFQLINSLVQQIEGKLEVERNGVTGVRIRFSVANRE